MSDTMQRTLFSIDNMEEITRAQYYDARNRHLVANWPYGFICLHRQKHTVYLTNRMKFYRGELPPDMTVDELNELEFVAVITRLPYGLFQRKRAKQQQQTDAAD